MRKRRLTETRIGQFEEQLRAEEKSPVTIEKYLRDVRAFSEYINGNPITKDAVVSYKQKLIEKGYAPASINASLASLHKLFSFYGWTDCCVKTIKVQRQVYCSAGQELTREEYFRLLQAAKHKPRLRLLLQTIGSTGIRVSELQYFTVAAVRSGTILVSCKDKTRPVLVPGKLRKKLLQYCKNNGIAEGLIFRTRSGRPLDRSNVWSEMKKLCVSAGVNAAKVFPHNLRKLFAKVFYEVKKDIAKLADVLGHKSIDTTRIYLVSSGREHRQLIKCLGLVT